MGKLFANVNIVNRVPPGGGGGYGTGRHKLWAMNTIAFFDGNLNVQTYRDEILRPIVVPFIHFSIIMHGPMSQGSIHNFWKLKMSQFEQVWDALDQLV